MNEYPVPGSWDHACETELVAVMHHCPLCQERTFGSFVNHVWGPLCPECSCLTPGMIRAFEGRVVYRKRCLTCSHLGPAGLSYREAEELALVEEFVGSTCTVCLQRDDAWGERFLNKEEL